MNLYLIRHAIAVDRDVVDVITDAARELTPEGVEKFRRSARALRRSAVEPREIWTSPLLRARQTAEILSDELKDRPPVIVVKALEPSGHFEEVIERLEQNSKLDAVALVGHEPYLGEITSLLIGGPRNRAIPIKKGGAACIEIDDFRPPYHGELRWLITPRQMGMMT